MLILKSKNDDESTIERQHTGVQCNKCKKEDFTLDRYKCAVCNDYDLCGECFEKKKYDPPHSLNHPMVRFNGPNELFNETISRNNEINLENFFKKFKDETHESVKCNGCDIGPIVGIRFKCYECYDYDLCYNCYKAEKETLDHKKIHQLLIIANKLTISSQNIKLDTELGKGGFGAVYKAKLLPSNKIVACKIITYNPMMEHFGKTMDMLLQSYIREFSAYNELNSNYIVKMYGHCFESINKEMKFYLLMEYMEKGSLANVLKNEKDSLSLRCRLQMATNIASAMRIIHERKFIHRDIRPDNILVTNDYTAKIADMGITKMVNTNDEADKNNTIVGCISYMPKEFYTGNYNQKLDIYMFGLTLHELFTGKRHLFINNSIRLTEKSPVFAELIENCLNDDPSKRLDAVTIDRTLRLYYNVIIKGISTVKEYSTFNKEKRDSIFISLYNYTKQKLIEFNRD